MKIFQIKPSDTSWQRISDTDFTDYLESYGWFYAVTCIM